MKTSKKLVIFLPIFALILALGVLSASPSRLGSVTAQTAYQTPTPNEIGQILYEVQEGDTCTRVFLLTNVSIADIIYYASFCGIMLFLTIRVIDKRRWSEG